MINEFIKKFLRKYLGVENLENEISSLKENNSSLERRIELSNKDRLTLEERIISSEKKERDLKKLIYSKTNQETLNSESKRFFESVGIELSEKNEKAILHSLKASEIVQRYGFERFVPPIERGYNTPIITIEEFRKNPTHYIHKLSKGALNFPVGINFEEVNNILERKIGNFKLKARTTNSEIGMLSFTAGSIYSHDREFKEYSNQLISATNIAELNRDRCDNWIYLDGLDFIHNYEGLEKYVSETPNVSQERKEEVIAGMRFAKFSYLTALEISMTTRIKDLSELIDYNEKEDKEYLVNEPIQLVNDFNNLKDTIKRSLLSEQKGMTYPEINTLLEIRSKERFVRLASDITNKIMANDKDRNGLTNNINKPLEEYSIGEAILLSTYFARNVIDKYKKNDDLAIETFCGIKEDKIVGKCTDYTGLAIHYLKEYLAPMQPEKFKNWQFGFDSDHIDSYSHCYMKILHINKDLTVDVYYADPTKLCSLSIDKLKTPEDVLKATNGMTLPILIKRDAEDILYSANEKME
ncbi:hypothetical protein KY334_00800 [Candidatus Woesearchaeota archaeon]|nr:hypothetical protein [Candidatus Woesearchaeota archaeon]